MLKTLKHQDAVARFGCGVELHSCTAVAMPREVGGLRSPPPGMSSLGCGLGSFSAPLAWASDEAHGVCIDHASGPSVVVTGKAVLHGGFWTLSSGD